MHATGNVAMPATDLTVAPGWGAIALATAVLIGAFFLVSQFISANHQGRVRIGAALAVILGVIALSFPFAARRSMPTAPEASSATPPVLGARGPVDGEAKLPSTEALWDRLTRARIELNGETASDVVARPGSEAKAVAEIEADKAVALPKQRSRPAWVDNPPGRIGDVYRRVVSSDRFSTLDECYRQLEQEFVEEVQSRLRTLLGDKLSPTEPVPVDVGIEYIMREICREEFDETVDASFGEMQRAHVLMEFTPAVDRQLRESWELHERQRQAQQRVQRLTGVGVTFGGVLALLGFVYGLLRFDTWTRGYYTKRLILAVPAAIILLIMLLLRLP